MALGSALVDRGRFLRRADTGKRVEGTKVHTDEAGAWFRCRLTMPKGNESSDGAHKREIKQPTLLIAKRNTDGDLIEFAGDDKVLVKSAQLGEATWEIDGDPEPIRRRRSILGWQATLIRVDE